jgi:hypothetical protein
MQIKYVVPSYATVLKKAIFLVIFVIKMEIERTFSLPKLTNATRYRSVRHSH